MLTSGETTLPDQAFAEVIGDPVAHSKSPLIHRFWLDATNVAGDYRKTQVTGDQLGKYFAERRTDPLWRGCNITMPHKIAALGLMDEVGRSAALVGAVNTVTCTSGKLVGLNTDIDGVAGPLAKPENAIGAYANHIATYAQIIGAGGAARAAAAAVGTDKEFYNRDVGKAKALAEECGLPEWYGQGLDAIGPIRNEGDGAEDQRYSHIVINATAMGMEGKPSVPIKLERYHPDTIVFDMVYAPVETSLLRSARALGLRNVDGLDMLIAQAAEAFEMFFGVAPPRERDAELRALLLA